MSDNLSNFERLYELQKKLDAEAYVHNRALFFAALQARGATSVEIEYEGSGDSGGIENRTIRPEGIDLSTDITVLVSAWQEDVLSPKTMPLIEALEENAMQLVEREHGGWENGEGGGGTVTYDVAPREILVEHHDYYVERSEFSHKY